MTKDIYDRLSVYEPQIISAQKANYAKFEKGGFDVVAGIYAELFGTKLTKSEMNCGMCKLKALKKIGVEYFKFQKWYEARHGKREESEGETNLAVQNNVK